MKKIIFPGIFLIGLSGCFPQTEAECLMDVSKNAQSDKAAILGKMACDKQFSSAPKSETLDSTQQSSLPTPKPGDVMDGYVFKGGDPSKKEAWENLTSNKD
jgi:hypothetical protein